MRKLIFIAAALGVGACDRDVVEKENASVAEVGEALAEARQAVVKFTPGRWESQVTVVSMDAPGLPPQVAQAMQGAVGKPRAVASCLTKEQAEKPAADFFTRDAKECTYDHFRMGGGKIDSKLSCARDGQKVAMTMTGAYDASTYDMNMETRVEPSDRNPSAMVMKMKVNSRRTGDCRGDEGKLG